jgi:hypothetical protein
MSSFDNLAGKEWKFKIVYKASSLLQEPAHYGNSDLNFAEQPLQT